MFLLLMGCGGKDAVSSDGETWTDYGGPAGRLLTYYTDVDTAGGGMAVHIEEDRWDVTEIGGDEILSTYAIADRDGLRLGDDLLLPDPLTEGAVKDGVTVVGFGPREVWYGNFPKTVEVRREDGAWSGSQVFALDVGPIYLTLDGASWQLAGYE